MAMLPFCGYNMADYFRHWLEVGTALKLPPKIFRVNWFRADEGGRFLWPGFSDNLRVLKWILDRCDGQGRAVATPIGLVPTLDAIDRTGMNLPDPIMSQLLRVDPSEWIRAIADQKSFMISFAGRIPKGILDEHQELARRLQTAAKEIRLPS
jgi:phosphoenolpyruvate carboxykinase (GTP)